MNNSFTRIQIANGSMLPITAVGTLGHDFNDVFVSTKLSTNLIYVGQLVSTNCDVHFLVMVVLCRIKCSGR